MSTLFGACIGAIIYCLGKHEEYFHAILAVLALTIYLLTIYGMV